MSDPSNDTMCPTCKKYVRGDDMRRHRWTYHPKNKTEEQWAKHARTNFRDWKGSSFYESFGPYY